MALITEILQGTLIAGQTGISFTNAAIPNSLIRIFSDDASLTYESATVSGTTLTIQYPAQSVNKAIAVELVKAPLSVIDNLTSDDADNALSAKQGKVLKDIIDNLPTGVTELSELDDVELTSLQDGQILVYDGLSEKFINSDNTPSNYHVYSTTEHVVGEWVDGSPIYEKTVYIPALPSSAGAGTYSAGVSGVNRSWITNASTAGDLQTLRVDESSYANMSTSSLSIRSAIVDGNLNIYVYVGRDRSALSAYVTVQYTKAS